MDKRLALLDRAHVDRMVAAKAAATPAAAHVFLMTLHVLMAHSVAMAYRRDDPTLGIKNAKLPSDGIHTWQEGEIGTYRAAHSLGSVARLSLELLLGAGQRRVTVSASARNTSATALSICANARPAPRSSSQFMRTLRRHSRPPGPRTSLS
jgi:hypothetical protein